LGPNARPCGCAVRIGTLAENLGKDGTMTEYLINCGGFNILVFPDRKNYYVLDNSKQARQLQEDFLAGRDLDASGLAAHWFKYRDDEVWHCMDGSEGRLGEHLDEAAIIDLFVLKKNNFGSLVAVRDSGSRKVKLFKRERLAEIDNEVA
jgi:hypothetical protein